MARSPWHPYAPDQAFGRQAAQDEELLDQALARLDAGPNCFLGGAHGNASLIFNVGAGLGRTALCHCTPPWGSSRSTHKGRKATPPRHPKTESEIAVTDRH